MHARRRLLHALTLLLATAACAPRATLADPTDPARPAPTTGPSATEPAASPTADPAASGARADERISDDPSKGGIIGRTEHPERVSGQHSLSLFYYEVGFELPDGVELQRQQQATSYAWKAPGNDHTMSAFEHHVPMQARSGADATTPLELARQVATGVGLDPESIGEGPPLLCFEHPKRALRGHEWHLEPNGASLWLVVFEHENPHARPDGFRTFMGVIVMAGVRGSPFAGRSEAVRRVRESIRITSMFDPKVDVRVGACPPKV